jgi:hypothetical protein
MEVASSSKRSQITNEHVVISKETVIFTNKDVETLNNQPFSVFSHHTYPNLHAILIHECVFGKISALTFNKVHA